MEITPFLGTLVGNIFLGIGIVFAIYVVKLFKNKFVSLLDYFTSITVGLLIGIIFLGFLPELIGESSLSPKEISVFILVGLLLFYILELFLHWHHCRDLEHDECSHSHSIEQDHKSNALMFFGTFIHNAFHGIIIFSAFSVNNSFGIATTFTIFMHIIPQNIVNFIMNKENVKYSYIATFGGLIGALLTYPFSNFLITHKFEILAIITGGLLYTALTDIFPNFKEKGSMKNKIIYLFFVIFGVLILNVFNSFTHSFSEQIGEQHEINSTSN